MLPKLLVRACAILTKIAKYRVVVALGLRAEDISTANDSARVRTSQAHARRPMHIVQGLEIDRYVHI
jgi:hypothetical protein